MLVALDARDSKLSTVNSIASWYVPSNKRHLYQVSYIKLKSNELDYAYMLELAGKLKEAAKIHRGLFDKERASMLETQAAGTENLQRILTRLPPEEARTAIIIDK